MADTIVTNSPAGSNDSGALGMVIAFIILLAVVVGGIMLFRSGAFNAPNTQQPGTNIDVTIPAPTGGGGGGGAAY